MLVDTHAHLNDAKFDGERDIVVARAMEQGVTCIINMGDTMESSEASVQLTEAFVAVYAGVGIHPEEARPMTDADDQQLAEWAEIPKVVAIGEIGLDYYWEKDRAKRELQKRIFIRQLDIARQLHLPVCVHDRDAHGDMLSILQREGRGVRGVMHCFSGSWEMAQELLQMGWYLGIDGPLTFKNAAKLPQMLQRFPLERILVETDSPYMAPVPMRGQRNEPAFVYYVARRAAEIRGESFEDFAAATTENAKHLYGI
jgi:TatD DNase family protein